MTTVKVCYCGAVPYSLVSVLVRFTDAVVVDINGKTEHSRGLRATPVEGSVCVCVWGGGGGGGGGGALGRYACVPVHTSISNFLLLKEMGGGGRGGIHLKMCPELLLKFEFANRIFFLR